MQEHGTVNADGFGVGWYEPAVRSEPALYRSSLPIWADRSFASMAGVIATGATLGAVRSATEPVWPDVTNIPPFESGDYLFAHNGSIDGFRDGPSSALRRGLSERRDAGILGTTDSEVVFALVLDQLDGGADLASALVSAVRAVTDVAPARLNLVLTDGLRIAATAFGDTLFVRQDGDGVYVCSEPFDHSPAWKQIDDRVVVEATPTGIAVAPLELKGAR
jgi:glutamine amidotransferase